MRAILGAVLLLGLSLARPAVADEGPAIVIPGRPGVPVMINGRDASYAVVEGDWGLGKSVHVQPVVTYNYWIASGGFAPAAPPARYFPRNGGVPGYGRLEIEPPAHRVLPPPAESYSRGWAIESQPGPATSSPPYDPPQVLLAPDSPDRPPPRRTRRPGSGHGGRR